MLAGDCIHCGRTGQREYERLARERLDRCYCRACGHTDHYRTDAGHKTYVPRRHIEPRREANMPYNITHRI